jgi:hypothetical protein
MTKKSFVFGLSGVALLIGLVLMGCGSAPAAETAAPDYSSSWLVGKWLSFFERLS